MCGSLHFKGKTWRLPTMAELRALYTDKSARGWPYHYRYWSGDLDFSNYYYYYNMYLGDGSFHSNDPSVMFYASCVSNP